MPIVFEEVTGEIAPERGAPDAEPRDAQQPDAADGAAAIRREVHLMRERERRLRAD